MAPKPIALRKQLEELAKATSKRCSKEEGESVTCTYLGQRYGSDGSPEYRASASDWVVPLGNAMAVLC